jgi:centromere protein C
MVPSDLPAEGEVAGKAAQVFNVNTDQQGNCCGYIMGILVLPPASVKDCENVGPCNQLFTVCHGQPQSLEVAYDNSREWDSRTAQRFLLSPRDLFRVPAGNCYRLQNHSKESDCFLSWTIIKPMQESEIEVRDRGDGEAGRRSSTPRSSGTTSLGP